MKLSEILKIGLTRYDPDSCSSHKSYMCNVIRNLMMEEKIIAYHEYLSARQAIGLKIDNCGTLCNYLVRHVIIPCHSFPDAGKAMIKFYQDWIKELESEDK